MKKRCLGILAMVIACALVLVGCSNAAEQGKKAFAGVWSLDGVVMSGTAMTEDEMAIAQALGTYLTLNEDGTGSFEMMGMEVAGTWSATDATTGKITLTDESELGMSGEQGMKLEDDKLIMVSNSDSLSFVKIDPSQKQETDIASALSEALSGSGSLSGATDSATSGTGSVAALDNAQELNVTLGDTDDFTIKVTGKGSYLGDPAFVVEVANKSKTTLLVDDDDKFSVAGKVASPIFSMEVPAGATSDELLWFDSANLGDAGVEVLSGVKGKLIVSNADTGEELAQLDFSV